MFEGARTEVQQEADRVTARLQVIDDLRLFETCQVAQGLDLHDDGIEHTKSTRYEVESFSPL